LLDRIDIKVAVQAVSRSDLGGAPGEPTAVVAHRVVLARQRQRFRWREQRWSLNAEAPGSALRRGPWQLDRADRKPLDDALDHGVLTLRGLDRCLRVAWTLADLEGVERPRYQHVHRALTMRDAEGVKAA